VRTLLLSLALASILDAVANRVSRPLLGVQASGTLWGTLATRTVAWLVAWQLTRPAAVPSDARR
jgi:hypothetical protein